jgi:hypothetical protein
VRKSEARLQGEAESASLTWDPIKGGKRAWICFDDFKIYDLGPDPTGSRFELISKRMMSGNYYPPDAVRFSGRFRSEKRDLQVGDRIVQQAPLFGKLGGPLMASSAEIYIAELDPDRCEIGYVTSSTHFARGIWSALLERNEGVLKLKVQSTASPNSWQFWLGLPYARFLQVRARHRAVEEFRKVR